VTGTLATTHGGTGLTSFTANGVVYASSTSALATGSALTFDGATVGVFNGTTVNYRFNANRGTDDTTQGLRLGFGGLDGYRTGVALASSQTQLNFTQTGSDGTRTPYYINSNGESVWSPGSGASPTEGMRLTSTGLGIGTSSPTSPLTVAGTSSVNWVGSGASTGTATIGTQGTGGSLLVQTPSVNTSFASGLGVDGTYSGGKSVINLKALGTSSGGTYSADLAFFTSTNTTLSEKMRLDSSGNLGLGVTPSGTTRLQVISSGNNLASFQDSSAAGAAYSVNTNGSGQIKHFATWANSGIDAYHTWYVTTSSGVQPQAMTLDVSGNLLVGTTSRVYTERVSINFTGVGQGMVLNTTATSSADQIAFNNGNGNVGKITTNGSSTTYTTSSDYRLKENIAPMMSALNVVKQLNPVTYKWKTDGTDGQGFIAHELQAIVPECVTGEKDAVDENGNPKYQAIDTSFLVATLTAAIQEQQTLIESLTTRLTTLENK
jgi:hypothetical protein